MAKGDVLAEESLRYTMYKVARALDGVTWALKRIDPQLTIHEPAIAREITRARESRGTVISGAERALNEFQQAGSTDSFSEVAQQAENALLEIEEATEQFRKFISEQFSFKESF